MTVDVRGRNLNVSESLRGYAQRRVQFAIGSFEARISRVEIRIADMNGPRGGVDKTSVITVFLERAGSLFATGVGASAYSAVDRAAARIRTILVRRLRMSARSRRTGQPLSA